MDDKQNRVTADVIKRVIEIEKTNESYGKMIDRLTRDEPVMMGMLAKWSEDDVRRLQDNLEISVKDAQVLTGFITALRRYFLRGYNISQEAEKDKFISDMNNAMTEDPDAEASGGTLLA